MCNFLEHIDHLFAVPNLALAKLLHAVVVLNELSIFEKRNRTFRHLKSYQLKMYPVVNQICLPHWNAEAGLSYLALFLSP